jgi:DNA-binding NtrC family response regulator
VVLPEHLPGRVRPGDGGATPPPGGDPQRLEEIERDAILATLKRLDFNRTETAKALAISRRALTYKIQRLRELGFPVDPPA